MNPLISRLIDELHIPRENHAASTGIHGLSGPSGVGRDIVSPVDGSLIMTIHFAVEEQYDAVVAAAQSAFLVWRKVPAPKRGEIIRQLGESLSRNKDALGTLVSLEMGKSLQEGLGEVQEMIDICVFAAGLSRQLYGLTIPSERTNHRMMEQYHPLGIVGIISAFNFPVAVWAWNVAVALVCGDVCIWKPSEKTPVTALASHHLLAEILAAHQMPEGISSIVLGDRTIGQRMAEDARIALVSATGSVRMGLEVAASAARRLGKTLLELGGNNAIVITPNADLKAVLPGIVFGAIGTAGQRCTSTRRLIVHRSIVAEIKTRLTYAYASIKIGNPLASSNHMGPLIDLESVSAYMKAIEMAKEQGGLEWVVGKRLEGDTYPSECYVAPSIIEMPRGATIVKDETFAPLLYVILYDTLEEAIEIHNDVPQGLSSAIMTNDISEAETFISAGGSDCGIANINLGTSGAEIGGAFGGEKQTGGGRESGSDAWKAYMRRQTNTINYGKSHPLAQGIQFEIDE